MNKDMECSESGKVDVKQLLQAALFGKERHTMASTRPDDSKTG